MNGRKEPKTFFLCCVILHTTDNFSLDSLWKFRRMILFNKVQSREKKSEVESGWQQQNTFMVRICLAILENNKKKHPD